MTGGLRDSVLTAESNGQLNRIPGVHSDSAQLGQRHRESNNFSPEETQANTLMHAHILTNMKLNSSYPACL